MSDGAIGRYRAEIPLPHATCSFPKHIITGNGAGQFTHRHRLSKLPGDTFHRKQEGLNAALDSLTRGQLGNEQGISNLGVVGPFLKITPFCSMQLVLRANYYTMAHFYIC